MGERRGGYIPKNQEKSRTVFKDTAAAERFAGLVDTHYQRLVGYVSRISNDPSSAEDIMQEAFINVARALSSGAEIPQGPTPDGKGDLEEGYMNRVARNAWIDDRRKRNGARGQRPEPILMERLPEYAFDADTTFDKAVVAKIVVHDACKQLSPTQRAVVELFFLQGLSQEDVAQKLDISPTTVRTTFFKAKKNLRTLLEK